MTSILKNQLLKHLSRYERLKFFSRYGREKKETFLSIFLCVYFCCIVWCIDDMNNNLDEI